MSKDPSSTPILATLHPSGEALEESEARFRLMVASVRDYAIFLLDPTGKVQTWNAGAKAIKGYTEEEIVGHHISLFYCPGDVLAKRPQKLLDIAVRDGRVEDEGWRVRKDGTRFWADVVITAVFGEDRRLRGFIKVTRDLTARREAEEALRQSEERFRVLVQSVRDYAIFMLDPQGRVTTWNAGATRIKRYTPEEIIGQHFSRFYLPEDVAGGRCEQTLEQALSAGKFEEEGWRLRKDGERFWAGVVIEPMRDSDNRIIGFAMVIRDLTERRAAEAERMRLLHAQEAIRLRDDFLSIASHELKTPLSAMQLQLQSLLQNANALDEKTRRKAERAYRGGERLSELIEALLDVSRIATGKFSLTPRPFDLGACVADVVERFTDQAAQEGCTITLRLDEGVTGEWDRLRIEQITTNLLSNALKYAAGTPVDIEVKAIGDKAFLVVADQGPGIAPEDWDRVFGRFERAAPSRHFGGLGLGLYVSRQIAEAHGGAIGVERVAPRGIRFIVTLPRRFVVGEARTLSAAEAEP